MQLPVGTIGHVYSVSVGGQGVSVMEGPSLTPSAGDEVNGSEEQTVYVASSFVDDVLQGSGSKGL